jgi:hypothetical protein
MTNAGRLGPVLALEIACLLFLQSSPVSAQEAAATLRDWEVQSGFRLDIAARGFNLPTAIAIVPRPGPDPEDPIYFVAELHGRIKVVTRSGSIHSFAQDFAHFRPVQALPINDAENGAAGLCVDPATGYVFVTYVYHDPAGTLRNGVTRFESKPHTFALRATRAVSMDAVLAGDVSSNSHQIGPCQVVNGHLMIAVGNGLQRAASRALNSTLGKILRLMLDGRPPEDNPFSTAGLPPVAKLIWASGFRNVFSLKAVGERVFVAENGLRIDRFLELDAGRDYLYEGSDWTIGLNAPLVFSPSVSPVQMDFASADYTPFPLSHRQRFYVALAGRSDGIGPGIAGERSVVAIDYDFEQRRVKSVPEVFLRWTGTGRGSIVGLGLGPDGLYFAPLFPGPDGTSPIIRVSYDPDRPHARIIGERFSAPELMLREGCVGCHKLGAVGGEFGPALDDLAERLDGRLASPEYLRELGQTGTAADERFMSLASRRLAVINAPAGQRARVWLVNWLLDPAFAKPVPRMPKPNLSEGEANVLADFLLGMRGTAGSEATRQPWTRRLPPARHRHTAAAFLLGSGVTLALLLAARRLRGTRRKRSDGAS